MYVLRQSLFGCIGLGKGHADVHQTLGNRQIKTTWSEIGNERDRDFAYSVTAVSAAYDMITIRMLRKIF